MKAISTLLLFISVLSLSGTSWAQSSGSSASGRDGAGGFTQIRSSDFVASKDYIQTVAQRAPFLYRLYLEYAGKGEDGLESLAGKKIEDVLHASKNAKHVIEMEKACYLPNDTTEYEATTYNNTICISPYMIEQKNFRLVVAQQRVMALYAHEMAHLLGADHSEHGENIANEHQNNFADLAFRLDVDDGIWLNRDRVLDIRDLRKDLRLLADQYDDETFPARKKDVRAGLLISTFSSVMNDFFETSQKLPLVPNHLSMTPIAVSYQYATALSLFQLAEMEKHTENIFAGKTSMNLLDFVSRLSQLDPETEINTFPGFRQIAKDMTVYNGLVLSEAEKAMQIRAIEESLEGLEELIIKNGQQFLQDINLNDTQNPFEFE